MPRLCGGPGAQVSLNPTRVKLLFDQNFSYRLPKSLDIEFPESPHVRHVGLDRATDWSCMGIRKSQRLRYRLQGL
jgi:hypothetical protein